jgi:hypothetical protein
MPFDVTHVDKIPRFEDAGLGPDDIEDISLLKNEPAWACLLEFRAKLALNELGHEFGACSFVVETAAYLYAAARTTAEQCGDEQKFPAWDDIEKLLDSFADESALLTGILDGRDDPVKIIQNLNAIMPADVLNQKPSNCSLGQEGD